MDFIAPYQLTVLLLGLTGLMIFIQLLISDVMKIKAGHTPGVSVEQSHKNTLFRSSRAFENSNESVGIFILFILFAIFSLANSFWVNAFALVYFSGRLMHMITYYMNLKLFRSIAFAIACIGLFGLFGTGVATVF